MKMIECGIMEQIFPSIMTMNVPHNSKFHQEVLEPFGNTILAHTLLCLKSTCDTDMGPDKNAIVRMAALFHDIGKNACRKSKADGTDSFVGHDVTGADTTRNILTENKLSVDFRENVCDLIANHMIYHDMPKSKHAHTIRKICGKSNFDMLRVLCNADTSATENDFLTLNEEVCIDTAFRLYIPMLPNKLVTGKDLIAAGIKPCEEFSRALDIAYNLQLDTNASKQNCLKQAISYIKQMSSTN